MNILKNLFKTKTKENPTIDTFWEWFKKHEKTFFKVVKTHKNIEEKFFDKIRPKLGELKAGIFFLTGMYDDNTVELVLTPDGNLRNIDFIERMIAASPQLENWKFTALKPAIDIENMEMSMAGYNFSKDNLWFYTNEDPKYPDEIDLTFVHADYNEENETTIQNGTYIFLDNYLGEWEFATAIDAVSFVKPSEAAKELIGIEKLKDFLKWRKKEFIEKYEGTRHHTDEDSYTLFEAMVKGEIPIIAVINTEALQWDKKASHPWIVCIKIDYSEKEHNGLPREATMQLMDEIEDIIMEQLTDSQGYINIGRETGNCKRLIYFTCKEFRKPSRILDEILIIYQDKITIDYDIFKDKYWRIFNRYLMV